LNASIEAVRAGSAGRAFGVVAGEVRQLAERARAAAEHSHTLIHQVTQESRSVSERLGLSAERILQEGMNAQSDVPHLLALIREVAEQNQRRLDPITDQGERLSEEIGRMVATFQFHDHFRRRLEQIAEPLCTTNHQNLAQRQRLRYAAFAR
jgi:methyl-accepting chemotaxis protein